MHNKILHDCIYIVRFYTIVYPSGNDPIEIVWLEKENGVLMVVKIAFQLVRTYETKILFSIFDLASFESYDFHES